MKKLLIIALLSPYLCSAKFNNLFNEFKQYRKELKIKHFETQKNNIEFDLAKYSNQPYLFMGYEHDDRFLDALFSFQANHTIAKTSQLGIKKDFDAGLSFSVAHKITDYDLSNWSASSLSSLSSDRLYEHYNSIGLEIDLLKNLAGYSRNKEITAATYNHQAQKEQIQDQVFKEYLSFFNAYVELKIKYSEYIFQKQYKKKSAKTYKLLKKRVRDGLSKKADLLQAQLSFTEQSRKEKASFVSYQNQLRIMNQYWGEKTKNVNLNSYKIKQYEKQNIKFSVIDNLQLKSLANTTKKQRLLKKIKNRQQLPDLKLSVDYIANAFNEDTSEAFDQAVNNRSRKETKVALNLNWGLGSVDTLNSENQDMSNRITELKYQGLLEEIRNQKKNSEALHTDLYGSLISKKEQTRLAEKIVKEHNRMYLRGQVSLDQLIRSEEQVLNQKGQFYAYLQQYLKTEANLYYLAGELNSYLNKYMGLYETTN